MIVLLSIVLMMILSVCLSVCLFRFPCLTGDCEANITLNTLQSIVPSRLFSQIIKRLQEEEVQQANIPDLVTCPFCPFATIMSNPDDKVLKCLNPDCLKESCRWGG